MDLLNAFYDLYSLFLGSMKPYIFLIISFEVVLLALAMIFSFVGWLKR